MVPTLRPICRDDEAFLLQVYASTREDELAQVDWSQEQKNAFVCMQFEAQRAYYETMFPAAAYQIILVGDRPVGRPYVDQRDDEIRLIDIALLPEQRGAGIGTTLLDDILVRAQTIDKKVRIHVEQFNPAVRLYERLGFVNIEQQGIYFLMEWSPADRRVAGDRPNSINPELARKG